MHAQDRLAAIAVLDKTTDILRAALGADAQSIWPVLGALLKTHLSERPSTITALADLSGLPRTTARRIVFELKARGWLEFRAISGRGSRATIVPSATLLDRLDAITEQTVKMMVGARERDAIDLFDASGVTSDAGIPWPRPARAGFDDGVELTLIAYEDPVFDILKHNRSDIERFVGHRVKVMTFPQDTFRDALRQTLTDPVPNDEDAPSLVAIPFPWLAELCDDGHLLDLQSLQAAGALSGSDFYDEVWRAGWFDKHLYAIPIQPTLEFLWYRQDLFEADGLDAPRTFEDVLRCAARLQRRSRDRAGITWNAAPGLPLAESFLQILGAQGGVHLERGVLQVDTDVARSVIDYLRELIPWSPPDLRSVQWQRNAQIFGAGKAAMCYHWSNRYGMLDSHALLQKGGRVGLQLHPTYSIDVTPLSPLGGALLAIPARNEGHAAQRAWRAIETLSSPELMKYFVLHGAAGSARHSVAEDAYVLQRNRVIAVIDRLAKDRQVRAFPSPAVPGYHGLIQTLSDHLEGMLFGGNTDVREGLGKLQIALERVKRRPQKRSVPRRASE